VIVSINRFADDSTEELEDIKRACADNGITAVITDYRESGGQGGIELAEALVQLCATPESDGLQFCYDTDMPVIDKIKAVAQKIYGASGLEMTTTAKKEIDQIENLGYGDLPICIAKTPASFTDDPKVPGCPSGFNITVTSARVSAGAGFIVIYTGEIMTMPGLPKRPAALEIDVDEKGSITGLF